MDSFQKPQCLILAGGLATRMRPLTDKVPKALLEVGGKPFADYQLRWLSQRGISEVIYSIAYKGGMIRDYVEDGRKWGLTVRYVDEGSELLGTAGAVRLAFDQGKLAPVFMVLYGDSFLPIDFNEIWKKYFEIGYPCLMTVLKNESRWDKSNVIFENNRVLLYDKVPNENDCKRMKHIDYGLSVLNSKMVERIPPGEKCDLAGFFKTLSLQNELAGLEVSERFYEIGSPSGLKDFESWVKGAGL